MLVFNQLFAFLKRAVPLSMMLNKLVCLSLQTISTLVCHLQAKKAHNQIYYIMGLLDFHSIYKNNVFSSLKHSSFWLELIWATLSVPILTKSQSVCDSKTQLLKLIMCYSSGAPKGGLGYKYSTRAELIESDRHASLLHNSI
jgi:hypothetical protein